MVGYTSKKNGKTKPGSSAPSFSASHLKQWQRELSKRYSLTTHSLRAPTGREKLGGANTNGLNLGLGGRESEQSNDQETIKRGTRMRPQRDPVPTPNDNGDNKLNITIKDSRRAQSSPELPLP